jgi:hypothetical protein
MSNVGNPVPGGSRTVQDYIERASDLAGWHEAAVDTADEDAAADLDSGCGGKIL